MKNEACNDIANLIGPYVVDDIPEVQKRLVEAHLTTCMDCRKRILQLRAAASLLQLALAGQPAGVLEPARRAQVLRGDPTPAYAERPDAVPAELPTADRRKRRHWLRFLPRPRRISPAHMSRLEYATVTVAMAILLVGMFLQIFGPTLHSRREHAAMSSPRPQRRQDIPTDSRWNPRTEDVGGVAFPTEGDEVREEESSLSYGYYERTADASGELNNEDPRILAEPAGADRAPAGETAEAGGGALPAEEDGRWGATSGVAPGSMVTGRPRRSGLREAEHERTGTEDLLSMISPDRKREEGERDGAFRGRDRDGTADLSLTADKATRAVPASPPAPVVATTTPEPDSVRYDDSMATLPPEISAKLAIPRELDRTVDRNQLRLAQLRNANERRRRGTNPGDEGGAEPPDLPGGGTRAPSTNGPLYASKSPENSLADDADSDYASLAAKDTESPAISELDPADSPPLVLADSAAEDLYDNAADRAPRNPTHTQDEVADGPAEAPRQTATIGGRPSDPDPAAPRRAATVTPPPLSRPELGAQTAREKEKKRDDAPQADPSAPQAETERPEDTTPTPKPKPPPPPPPPPPADFGKDKMPDKPELGPVFAQIPVNPFVLTDKDRFSTFSIDTDTASYTVVRNYLRRGYRPPPAAVRMEEFVNAFDYNYPRQGNRTFTVHADAAPSPFGRGLVLLKVGVRGQVIGRDRRRASHTVFAVDASGSMGRDDRMPLVQEGLTAMLKEMAPQDRVSLITYNLRANLVLDAAPATDRDGIATAVQSIQTGGTTNLAAGVELAFRNAVRNYNPSQINSVILCSDGVANVGPSEAAELVELAEAFRRQGISFHSVGFGSGNYNDVVLETMANRGDGQYVFVDSLAEARRLFTREMSAKLNVIAKDVKIQVEFDPTRVRRYRLIGYENRDIADRDFRNDAVDAGEVGSGQSVTALYELELYDTPRQAALPDLGTVRIRYRDVESGTVEEIAGGLRSSHIDPDRTPEEDPYFFLAACAAEFAELLRHSQHAGDGSFEGLLHYLDRVAVQLPLDTRVQELLDLATRAPNLPTASN